MQPNQPNRCFSTPPYALQCEFFRTYSVKTDHARLRSQCCTTTYHIPSSVLRRTSVLRRKGARRAHIRRGSVITAQYLHSSGGLPHRIVDALLSGWLAAHSAHAQARDDPHSRDRKLREAEAGEAGASAALPAFDGDFGEDWVSHRLQQDDDGFPYVLRDPPETHSSPAACHGTGTAGGAAGFDAPASSHRPRGGGSPPHGRHAAKVAGEAWRAHAVGCA